MKDATNFTVLMSVYAKENPTFLTEALDSVLAQTIEPSEIVLVKDGPLTFELEKVIDNYINKYPENFKIISLQENKGLGIALKIGVDNSSFDIIARMDSDDIAKSDRFEKQLKVLTLNPDVDIVGSYIKEFEGDITNILSVRKVPTSSKEIYDYARRRNPFNHMTVMFRKNAVYGAGNYKQSLYTEDYYLWARMIKNNSKMANIPESLVYARTGRDLFKRRGGLIYVKSEINLQKKLYSIGFINLWEAVINVGLRVLIRIMPNALRGYVYKKLLRG